jgi:hypothetical protein
MFFGVGAAGIATFLGLYLVNVKPWRARPGEARAVKRERRNTLTLYGVIGLLYASSAIGLATLHTHPSTDPDRLALSFITAALIVDRLVSYIRTEGDS